MKYIYIALILIAAGSCKKSKTADPEIVERFVREVKADKYEDFQELPAFRIGHIDALMMHAMIKYLRAQ